MKEFALFLLRITLGWLMVVWGVDKLVDMEGAVRLADTFYWGIGTGEGTLVVFGYAEILLGVLVVIGWFRWMTWPIMAVINGLTLAGVWASVVDPWGFWLDRGGSMTFYTSAIVLAAILVAWAFMDRDTISVDKWRERG